MTAELRLHHRLPQLVTGLLTRREKKTVKNLFKTSKIVQKKTVRKNYTFGYKKNNVFFSIFPTIILVYFICRRIRKITSTKRKGRISCVIILLFRDMGSIIYLLKDFIKSPNYIIKNTDRQIGGFYKIRRNPPICLFFTVINTNVK